MPEGTEGQQQSQGGTEGQQQSQGSQSGGQQQTPPWDREGQQFDPERAWQLITSLRDENGNLKTERQTLQGRVSEHEQQSMTEAQRLTQRAETAEQSATTASAETARLQIALKHGLVTQKDGAFALDEDALDLLGNGSAEELDARAKRISALRGGGQQQSQGFAHGAQGTPPKGDMNSLILGGLKK